MVANEPEQRIIRVRAEFLWRLWGLMDMPGLLKEGRATIEIMPRYVQYRTSQMVIVWCDGQIVAYAHRWREDRPGTHWSRLDPKMIRVSGREYRFVPHPPYGEVT